MTVIEALTMAAEQFELDARGYALINMGNASLRKMDMAKMCRAAIAEHEARQGSHDPRNVIYKATMTVDGVPVLIADDPPIGLAAIARKFSDANFHALEKIAAAFSFAPCSRCQWPHICGYRNPCNLAAMGIPNEPVLDRDRHNTGWSKP